MSEPVFDGSRREELRDRSRAVLSAKMGDLWWTFLVRGILAAILGVIALFWPTDSISILLRITGLFLVFDGAVTFLGVWKTSGNRAEIGSGFVSLALGLVLLLLPTGAARIVFILLGLWALVRGLSLLLTWWQTPSSDPERDSARNAGIVAVVVGVVLVFWPGTGVVALGWVIAIAALVLAAVMFFLASRFKRIRDRMQSGMDQ
jgi:uncharacterized membrane protein HdeD (DUF308 family)